MTERAQSNIVGKIIGVILIIAMLIGSAIPISATDEEYGIMPCYAHCAACTFHFGISNGEAIVAVDYVAYEGTFNQISIKVKIQKKTLGIFWNTVDIGEPDNIWSVNSWEYMDFIEGRFPISSKGTYRAIFEVRFHGSGGIIDELDRTLEFVYD